MNKPILYSDFDGVILNTIDTSFDIMRENNCNMNDGNEIDYFFRRLLNWEEVYSKSVIINDAINKLLFLKKANIFQDIIVLTKLSGNYNEERIKRDFLYEVLPEISIITLQYGLKKSSVVNPVGNILLDDETRNCIQWNDANGTAVLFNNRVIDYENDIINDILDITKTNGVKKLMKSFKKY